MRGPGDILPWAVRHHATKLALVSDGRSLTYAELDDAVARVAGALVARGIRPGDRVSIYSENRWEWVVAYHAILRADAVVNPLNVMLTTEEVAYVVGDCSPTAIFSSPHKTTSLLSLLHDDSPLRCLIAFGDAPAGAVAFQDLLAHRGRAPVPSVHPSDLSTIGYTSGTTGHPKGAMQSQRAVLLNCALTATMHCRVSSDVVVTALPVAHVYGNVVVNGTFLAGGTVVLMQRFDPSHALRLISEHRATLFEGVPSMYAMMLNCSDVERTELSSLSRCTVGGQTIPVATIEAWQEVAGAPMIELWGMTELSGLGTTHPLYAPNVPGSIGVALPGIEVGLRSLDESGAVPALGEPGEIVVRGPLVMLGYYGNQDATAETIDPHGWLHTGDIAYSDDTGHFFLVDRLKDVIITGGYNVYPAEIERVLAGHPAVAMVAVGSVPDRVKGEVARAYVVPVRGASPSEADLIEFCRRSLASYKLPRSVRLVADLPKTSTGKIMRRELKRLDMA